MNPPTCPYTQRAPTANATQEVEASLRGTFASQESALQNVFEMLSFASTVVFARPEQFKYPATISAAAVGLAGAMYTMFVRMRRGHLLHRSKCLDRRGKGKREGYQAVAEEDGTELHERDAEA